MSAFQITTTTEEHGSPFGIPVRRYLDLSTAHISKADNDLLRGILEGSLPAGKKDEVYDLPFYVEDLEQGWIVSLYTEELGYPSRDKVLKFGFSLAFVELLRLAEEHCFRGVWFDADAHICDVLPKFDW